MNQTESNTVDILVVELSPRMSRLKSPVTAEVKKFLKFCNTEIFLYLKVDVNEKVINFAVDFIAADVGHKAVRFMQPHRLRGDNIRE